MDQSSYMYRYAPEAAWILQQSRDSSLKLHLIANICQPQQFSYCTINHEKTCSGQGRVPAGPCNLYKVEKIMEKIVGRFVMENHFTTYSDFGERFNAGTWNYCPAIGVALPPTWAVQLRRPRALAGGPVQ
jgi:hypothetical protein